VAIDPQPDNPSNCSSSFRSCSRKRYGSPPESKPRVLIGSPANFGHAAKFQNRERNFKFIACKSQMFHSTGQAAPQSRRASPRALWNPGEINRKVNSFIALATSRALSTSKLYSQYQSHLLRKEPAETRIKYRYLLWESAIDFFWSSSSYHTGVGLGCNADLDFAELVFKPVFKKILECCSQLSVVLYKPVPPR
jgi:hypothetical protein